ncbi:MAG TPA: hypothetical protein VHM26_08920 [Chitinophagaceae bacterium]|nr:hypothetical protein [Chitinophagaceae bacterium]
MKPVKKPGNAKLFIGADSNYAIFPAYDRSISNAPLSKEDIGEIEKILKQATDERNNGIDSSLSYFRTRPLNEYRRQIVATYNEKGEKVVWVNCLCREFGGRWRKEIISVYDGGSCFFNITINLTTKTFYEFTVNGVA